MPEWGSSGSVRGDTSNGVPYRDRSLLAIRSRAPWGRLCHGRQQIRSIILDPGSRPISTSACHNGVHHGRIYNH